MAKIHDQEASLPALTGKVMSSNLRIGGEVRRAGSAWEGKKENDEAVRDTLRKYWAVLGLDHPPSIAWSAAFVSYLLRKRGFKGDPYHTTYVANAINGTNGSWQAFSIPKNKDKIVVSVGDVLVEPRSGSYEASHGDVVYNIREGAADLIGGNLSDSIGYKSIGLNPDGTISDAKNYLVILKKNPSAPWWFYTKRVALWTTISAVVGFTGYYGYQYYRTGEMPRLTNCGLPIGRCKMILRKSGYTDMKDQGIWKNYLGHSQVRVMTAMLDDKLHRCFFYRPRGKDFIQHRCVLIKK